MDKGKGLAFDNADNDGTAKFRGQAGDEGAEARILKRKGGGGFGPDEEVRLLRAWGRPQAQAGKVGKIDLMLSVPVALIFHLLRVIRLDDAGKMMRLGLRNKARANPPDEQQRGHDGEQGSNPTGLLAWERAIAPNQQRIERCNEKRQAIDARKRRQLYERGIFRRGVAEQSPGKTDLGQVGTQDFCGNPEKRGSEKGQGEAKTPQSADHPGE